MDVITVFILDLNRSEETINCVNQLLEFNKDAVLIHILINGSEAQHNKKIKEYFCHETKVYVHESNVNLGFSGGVNHLFKEALKQQLISDYILLLNNDALVGPETLSRLKTVLFENKNIGIVGPRVLNDDDGSIIAEDGVRLFPWLMQHTPINSGKRSDQYNSDDPKDMQVVNGTCMMIKTEIFKALEGLDELYFAYFEDWDLCLRAKKIGCKVAHVSNAVISHIGSASTGKGSIIYQFLMTRNRYLIACKYLRFPVFHFIFIPYFIISRILIKALLLLINKNITGIKGVVLALCWLVVSNNRKDKYWPIKNSQIPDLM